MKLIKDCSAEWKALAGKSTRSGMVKNIETIQQRRRRYRIHAYLKKNGCIVIARQRTVILPGLFNQKVENKASELSKQYYSIQNPLL